MQSMNAIAVLNLMDFMPSIARRGFLKAAERWNCQFVEITEPPDYTKHHYWQKALIHLSGHVASFERVLQLDADMLVADDCPNPFDVVPCNKIGVVSRVQPMRRNLAMRDPMTVQHFARKYRVRPYRKPRQHLNAGLVLYNQKSHAEILQRWKAKAERGTERPRCPLPEQFVLSCILAEYPLLVHWLPWQYNACRQINGQVPQEAFIAHFHAPRKRPLAEIMRRFEFKRG
jgi:hypothetical protein